MTTPNPLPAGVDGLNYGFGLVISDVERLPAIWHNGGLQGWSSNLVWLPQQRVTLVALANALPAVPGVEPSGITHELAKHFLDEEIKNAPLPKEDKTIDPRTYYAYVGRYDYAGGIMTVTVEDNRLFAQITRQERFEIFPRGTDDFFWKITDSHVHFLRNEKGEVVAAQHTQNGNIFRAPRLAAASFEPTAEQLDAYVGQYLYSPLAVMTIKREGTQLMAQLSSQPEFPIFPVAADKFEWRVVKASVHFNKGEDGKVNKAVHSQNGVTFDAPKVD